MDHKNKRLNVDILKTMKKIKSSHFGDVAIDGEFEKIPYEILLMTSACAQDSSLMGLIGRWRKENEMWFSSQFVVTTERTTRWFKEKLIDVPDRILFIIKINDAYIGHIGLFRFDFKKKFCEIDNIVRGEDGFPGIMRDAIRQLMAWGIKNLGLEYYGLKVFSDNSRAIRLYERLGFRQVSRIPLVQVSGKDGMEWIEAPDTSPKDAERFYVIMETLK